MTESTLITESLRLMGVGMGIVFSFLLVLVALLRLMSWAVQRFAPPDHEAHPSPMLAVRPLPAVPGSSLTANAPGSNDELIAVLTAAVARFRADP